jgi:hypothetical protein
VEKEARNVIKHKAIILPHASVHSSDIEVFCARRQRTLVLIRSGHLNLYVRQ